MIYFIKNQKAEAIKIGYTKNNIRRRLATLQISSPECLELLGVMKGKKKEEKELHAKFKHLSIRGEWFNASEELHRFINENIEVLINAKPPKAKLPKTKTVITLTKRLLRQYKSYQKVARELSITVRYVRHLEKGERVPSEHLRKLIKLVAK